jgi:hypothetical protein
LNNNSQILFRSLMLLDGCWPMGDGVNNFPISFISPILPAKYLE